MTRVKIMTSTMTIIDKQSNSLEEDQEVVDFEGSRPFSIPGNPRPVLAKKAASSY